MSTRKSFILLFVLAFATEISVAQSAMRDVVYLKNGSIVKGIIVEQIPNVLLKIRTDDGNLFVFRFDEVEKLTKDESNTSSLKAVSGTKSPFLAGALSFVLPGAGQLYNGDLFLGIVHLSLTAGGVVTALALGFDTEQERTGTREVRDFYGRFQYYEPEYSYVDVLTEWFFIGLGVYAATLVWSVIDAVVTANNHNEVLSAGGFSPLRIGIVPHQSGLRAHVAINF